MSRISIDHSVIPASLATFLNLQKDKLGMSVEHRDMERIIQENPYASAKTNYLPTNPIWEPYILANSISLGTWDFRLSKAKNGRFMDLDEILKNTVERSTTHALAIPYNAIHNKQHNRKMKHKENKEKETKKTNSNGGDIDATPRAIIPVVILNVHDHIPLIIKCIWRISMMRLELPYSTPCCGFWRN